MSQRAATTGLVLSDMRTPAPADDSRLSRRTLTLLRIAWLVVTAATLALLVASVPATFAITATPCPVDSCADGQLGPAGIRALHELGLSLGFYAGYAIALQLAFSLMYGAVAAVIFWRRSDDRMALLVSFALLTFGATTFSGLMGALVAAHPVWRVPVDCIAYTGSVAFTLFLFTFPDGRFVPAWTRWVALAWVLQQLPAQLAQESPLDTRTWPLGLQLLMFVGFLGSVVYAQVFRYRQVSSIVQRVQTKWVVFGISAGLAGFIFGEALDIGFARAPAAITPQSLAGQLVSAFVIYAAMLAIPAALGVAILRHRLFDVDLLINRALVYGALTVCIGGLYVLIVGALSLALQGRGNLVVSLVATGAVAVAFQPLRERLQRGINRLIYGQRDEPYAVLSQLGRRLEITIAPDAALSVVVETAAQALKLPYAAIQLGDGVALTDAATYGTPVGEPLDLQLTHQGERIGRLRLGARATGEWWSSADLRLLDDLARQAGAAAHAVRLTADLQRSRERIVVAREETRRRLRRDLHDGLAPTLAALALKASAIGDLIPADPLAAQALSAELEAEIRGTIREIRRLVYELRPPTLDELGLVAAIRERAAAESTRRRANGPANGTPNSEDAGAGLQIVVEAPDHLPPLSAAVEVAAYRIIQEALTNVVKHAQAGRCIVRLAAAHALEVEITDDGVGLPDERRAGVGLLSLRERAEELGGTCVIEAPPEGGTRVMARLPLLSQAPAQVAAQAQARETQ
jgi:signal transduction histidine kinase